MDNLLDLKNKILNNYRIDKDEAMSLIECDLDKLCGYANEIRDFFCKDKFDLCSIVNAKSGKCSEDCKFCAQSSFYKTEAEVYPLLDIEETVDLAKYNKQKGVLRYSLVTSGRKLNDKDLDYMCKVSKVILSQIDVKVCASFGLMDESGFKKAKEAGIVRIHNNIETSRRNFPNICTTHTYDDKINSIKAAQNVGLEVCSGGIMGLGETYEDRIDMALDLRELEIKSVPINMLNAIPGTPYEFNKRLTKDDMRRIVSIFRFILPDSAIRLAGGRGLLDDKGKSCFECGANAAITGDMLTTSGTTINEDISIVEKIGYKISIIE